MLLLNYSFTGSQDHDIDENRTENSEYANLRPGINIGAWRFRNYSTRIMIAMGKIAGILPTPMFLAISNF